MTTERRCGNECCKNPASKRCSACNAVWYCGKPCQKRDWLLHKKHCKPTPRSAIPKNLDPTDPMGSGSEQDQLNPLHEAARGGDLDMVMLLLDQRADVNAKIGGSTALHRAAGEGHKDVVALLLDRGANVAAMGRFKWTALLYSAHNGHSDVVALLLERGADVEAIDISGSTALHWAAWGGHKDVVTLLLDRGALVDAKDLFEQTALLHAAINGHKDVVALLENHGKPK